MHQLDNIYGNTDSAGCGNSELYNHTPSYSTDERGEITENEQLAGYNDTTKTANEDINGTGNSVITEAQDASNDGLVYSAVVRQDGIKTTVKTTAQIDEQQQQSVPDTSNDGVVYTDVVFKDGIKTTVKTTAQIDEQQQQSVPDTSNNGVVYTDVVFKDGIKTTVKTTVFKD